MTLWRASAVSTPVGLIRLPRVSSFALDNSADTPDWSAVVKKKRISPYRKLPQTGYGFTADTGQSAKRADSLLWGVGRVAMQRFVLLRKLSNRSFFPKIANFSPKIHKSDQSWVPVSHQESLIIRPVTLAIVKVCSRTFRFSPTPPLGGRRGAADNSLMKYLSTFRSWDSNDLKNQWIAHNHTVANNSRSDSRTRVERLLLTPCGHLWIPPIKPTPAFFPSVVIWYPRFQPRSIFPIEEWNFHFFLFSR